MAAGTIPDIVCVNKTDLKQLVEAGLVVDMKPYFDEYASDLDVYKRQADYSARYFCGGRNYKIKFERRQ